MSALLEVYAQLDIEPVKGDGVYIECRDGRRILDLYGGHAVSCLGHSHPKLRAALTDQANALMFQTNAVPMRVREEAAEKLLAFGPDHLGAVFFANSGAEANENALRIALRVTGRNKIVAVEHSFHGRSAAAAAVTWGSERWYGFPQAPFDTDFIRRDDVSDVAATIDSETAAVILEPVQGVAGAYDLAAEFLQAIEQRCKQTGALLIYDEVQTGVGRLGAPFGAQLHGARPDLLTTAKSLAGGFPCAALVMTEELAATMKIGDLGTTFGGGPLAAKLIGTVIDTIIAEDLLANVRNQTSRIRADCQVGPITGFQGAGFLHGLKTSRPSKDVMQELLNREILVGTSADPRVIRLLPPFNLASEHVDLLASALGDLAP